MTYKGERVTLQQLPYVHIPLNTSICHNNNNNNTNHTVHSLIDTCAVLPEIASYTSTVGSGSLSCTSSVSPNCNTIMCIVEPRGERLRFTFLPCGQSPAVQVSLLGVNSSRPALTRNLTGPHDVVTASINGEQTPIYIDITQRESRLTLGVQVLITIP